MSLAELLATLAERGFEVRVDGDQARLVGRGSAADLRAALAEHREPLLRLAASDARAPGGGSWRRSLARADHDTREAWALVAAGYQGQGLYPRAAEWLAWEDVTGGTPCPR